MSDKGNTIGCLVYTPPPSDVPLWAANPPIVAETPEEAAWLAKLHVPQGGLNAASEVGAVFDETGALAYTDESKAAGYLAGPEATQIIGRQTEPFKGEDGAKVLGKGEPAVCIECLVHAASSGATTLERL